MIMQTKFYTSKNFTKKRKAKVLEREDGFMGSTSEKPKGHSLETY